MHLVGFTVETVINYLLFLFKTENSTSSLQPVIRLLKEPKTGVHFSRSVGLPREMPTDVEN